MAAQWYAQRMRCKPDKAVVRLFNDDGTFLGAVNAPSVLWPLNAPYEVFTAENCKLIQDETVAGIVDAIPYRIGRCYQNAEAVTKALQEAGYAATQYCGWLFIGEQYPIHHSWVVLDGCCVIDLADEFTMLYAKYEQFGNVSGLQAAREVLVDFTRWSHQLTNSQRIAPFGIPNGKLLYIGAPCSREEGISIISKLVKAHPNHPCTERLVKANGHSTTKMQMMLQSEGLMD